MARKITNASTMLLYDVTFVRTENFVRIGTTYSFLSCVRPEVFGIIPQRI